MPTTDMPDMPDPEGRYQRYRQQFALNRPLQGAPEDDVGPLQMALQQALNIRKQAQGAALAGAAGIASGGGDVAQRLAAGFRSVGRAELAGMVNDPDFRTWIQQESGWNPNAISPANNQGKPNYGLFQFWAGHSWARPGMSPEEQAAAAATRFNLTPDRIRRFADQIRSGTYRGWG